MQQTSFFKNTFYIFFNRALVILSNLIVMIFCSHYLLPDAYGILQTFWLQTSVFATVISLGLATFLYSYDVRKILQIWQSIALKYKAIGVIVLLLLSLLYAITQCLTNVSFVANAVTFIALVIYIFTFSFGLILDALAVIMGRLRTLLSTSILYSVTYCIVHWLWTKGFCDATMLVCVLALVSLCKVLILYRDLLYRAEIIMPQLAPLELRAIAIHWKNIGLYDIFQMIFRFLDKFILTFIISQALLAVYANTTYEIPVFSLVFVAVQNASLVHFQSQTNQEHILLNIKQTSFLLGLFCISATVFFFFNASAFITLIFSHQYLSGLTLFYISCMKIPVYMFNVLGYYQYTKCAHLLVRHTFIDFVVTVILGVILYAFFDLEGLVIALLLGSYVFVGFNVWGIKKATNSRLAAFLPIKEWAITALFFIMLNFILTRIIGNVLDPTSLFPFTIRLGINGIIVLILLFRFKKQFNL